MSVDAVVRSSTRRAGRGDGQAAVHRPTPEALQLPTPAVLAWVDAQAALGCTRSAVFGALRQSGWGPQSAALLMALSPAERRGLGVAPTRRRAFTAPAAVEVPCPRGLAASGAPDAAAPRLGTKPAVRTSQRRVAVQCLATVPPLLLFKALLGPAECAALIDAARPRLTASRTVNTRTGGDELHPDRTSQGMFFHRGETALVARLEARIAALLGWPLANGEGLQVLRYPPGAEYRPHHDYFDPAEPGTAAILARGGQRVATLIVYLQAPEAGGATVFPDAGISVPPVAGDAVFFSYAQPHPVSLSLHGGQPVTAGEKWIATKWLRQRPFA